MDTKKRNIIILIILSILLLVIGIVVYLYVFSQNDIDNLIIDNDIVSEQTNDMMDNNLNNISSHVENTNNEEYGNNDVVEESNDYNEENIVSYFVNMESEVSNSKTFNEKFKEYFITIVDFIFYGKEINGYCFDKLTDTAKTKIIAIALIIDNKIDEYIPGYKAVISSTTGKIYTDVKERLVTSYMDIASTICKNDEKKCQAVKENFNEVKVICQIGWEFIKGLLKNGATKIKDWYEIYSGKQKEDIY